MSSYIRIRTSRKVRRNKTFLFSLVMLSWNMSAAGQLNSIRQYYWILLVPFAYLHMDIILTHNQNYGWENRFLAVQNSSIGDLVTDWLTDSLTHWLRTLLIDIQKNNLLDFRHFRHLIRVMRRHDLTYKHRKNCECCPVSQLIIR